MGVTVQNDSQIRDTFTTESDRECGIDVVMISTHFHGYDAKA